eukprot:scaffold35616_cov61-Phaeocystis_antarctica.AAC.5
MFYFTLVLSGTDIAEAPGEAPGGEASVRSTSACPPADRQTDRETHGLSRGRPKATSHIELGASSRGPLRVGTSARCYMPASTSSTPASCGVFSWHKG